MSDAVRPDSVRHGRADGRARAIDIYIIGLGAVSPLGHGVAELWQALFRPPPAPARNAIAGFPDGDASWRHAYARPGELPSAPGEALGTFEKMALSAIEEACADCECMDDGLAALLDEDLIVGMAIGTAAGDSERAEARRLAGGLDRLADCNPYRVADDLPRRTGLPLSGPVLTIANACAASLYALTEAADLIRVGAADVMLVVGADLLSRVTQAGFQKMTALDPDRCRPFDTERNGTVLGEGAAALVLASAEVVARLPRSPYCRLLASGTSCDAFHPTAPQPQGRDIRGAVNRALTHAGLDARQIGLVVPHGTGTPINDRIEGEMLGETFGAAAAALQVMPIKAHLGHSAGASGAFSVLAAAKALASRRVPPVLYLRELDPMVPLCLHAEAADLRTTACDDPPRALVSAYGFGGNNLSVVLEGMCDG